MAYYAEIGILNSAVVYYHYFSDTLPSNSPSLIIMYHLELTPESYKLFNKYYIGNYYVIARDGMIPPSQVVSY